MLHGPQSPNMRYSGEGDGAGEGQLIDIDRILAAARRQWRLVAALAVLGGLLGAAYVSTATPLYTSSGSVLIDKSSNRIVNELALSEEQTSSLTDEIAIASQAEVMRSEQLAAKVAKALGLPENEAFLSPSRSLLSKAKSFVVSLVNVSSWFSSDEKPEVAEDKVRQATSILIRNLTVSRVGGTTVLSIGYTSPDPQLSAKIAQTYAETYIVDQLDSKFEATRRAGGWLQGRIEELRQRSISSDQAVQKFRADNGLITTDGKLISEQQLTALNTQLTSAQSDAAAAQARYDSIKRLVDSGDVNSVVSESISNTVVSALRTKYLDSSKREGEISNRLGPNHQQAVRLRAEMAEYARLMFGELSRLAGSYENDLQVAKAKEASAQAAVQSALGVSADANNLQVELRELEREAETYRNLYQTFLQRYQQAIQQQSFPITEARIISAAYPADKPSKPNKSLILALAVFLGAAVGAALGGYREFRDRFFRTGDEVRDELGIELLGMVPAVRNVKPNPMSSEEIRQASGWRAITPVTNLPRYATENPLSSFAETLRSAKIAADLTIDRKGAKVIGVISMLPGEGKTTISANLGSLLAVQGNRTLLIDADLRNPGLTKSLAVQPEIGLQEMILNRRPLEEAVLSDRETGMVFLPVSAKQRILHTSELLGSDATAQMLSDAAKRFDYVIVDLPPLGPIVDVRAIAHNIDAFVLVIEWGATSRRLVRDALRTHPLVMEKCFGVILNNVDNDKMKLYREFGSHEFYSNRYNSYYTENA
ncbi:polysaccharide biosynthesis tyrosine autokinase [Aureimonas psammosilenae]|uniref:polysaccharide biosynthesis tyrosine autokinase n=1 Tax=Aureimonas psammosilenae TaxID=2495496 RepID=UPI001F2B3602|nr:polysaccharide biosynthesis tyrosine autokinase [Aureimonas psammosilenae]